jgi:hypothetical protein
MEEIGQGAWILGGMKFGRLIRIHLGLPTKDALRRYL